MNEQKYKEPKIVISCPSWEGDTAEDDYGSGDE